MSKKKKYVTKHKDNKMFKHLLQCQLKTVPNDKKLQLGDIKRICKYIDGSIFHETMCCLWSGYITNKNNSLKGTYINFYFKKKKVALHRLLYCNFVGELTSDEYLKFTCENKGMCCNINHLIKYKYQKKIEKKNKVNEVIKKDKLDKNLEIIFDK
jgi:hypothetical protein